MVDWDNDFYLGIGGWDTNIDEGSFESLMLSYMIDAMKVQEVSNSDIPGVYVQTDYNVEKHFFIYTVVV